MLLWPWIYYLPNTLRKVKYAINLGHTVVRSDAKKVIGIIYYARSFGLSQQMVDFLIIHWSVNCSVTPNTLVRCRSISEIGTNNCGIFLYSPFSSSITHSFKKIHFPNWQFARRQVGRNDTSDQRQNKNKSIYSNLWFLWFSSLCGKHQFLVIIPSAEKHIKLGQLTEAFYSGRTMSFIRRTNLVLAILNLHIKVLLKSICKQSKNAKPH